jgi:cell division protein FtsZ
VLDERAKADRNFMNGRKVTPARRGTDGTFSPPPPAQRSGAPPIGKFATPLGPSSASAGAALQASLKATVSGSGGPEAKPAAALRSAILTPPSIQNHSQAVAPLNANPALQEKQKPMSMNMTHSQPQPHPDFTPRIAVIGVGGGGTNAVNNMIAMGVNGIDFVVANTDAQALAFSRAERRVQLGPLLTQGLGAGAKPDIGRAAAEEATDEISRQLEGAHMAFVTAGMGGGTGTGAAPVIARMARERGILTVGVVTKPFDFEGPKRKRAAEAGIEELQQYVDTLIVIPNQNLFRVANERTTFQEAFKMADHVLFMGVKGVTDLMVNPGLVNLDFADIRTVMAEMGKAMMGTGEAEGENRAIRAAEAAINNPLLEDVDMRGARSVLVNITGGGDLTLYELDEAANRIRQEIDEEADMIFGSSVEDNMAGRIRVSIVATGIESSKKRAEPEKAKLGAVAHFAAERNAVSDNDVQVGASQQVAMSGISPMRPAATAVAQDGEASHSSGPKQASPGGPGIEPRWRGPQGGVPGRGIPAPTGGFMGMLRRGLGGASAPTQRVGELPRAEPGVAGRPEGADANSLEIPSFLRRQAS